MVDYEQFFDFIVALAGSLLLTAYQILELFITFLFIMLAIGAVTVVPVLLIAGVVMNLIARSLYMKVYAAYLEGDYPTVIAKGKKIFKWYRFLAKICPLPKMRRINDGLRAALAVSFFATGDTEMFLKHIKAIKHTSFYRHSWLGVYYLLQDDTEAAKEQYQALQQCGNESAEMLDYLNALMLYKEGDIVNAKCIMTNVYPRLKVPFAKEIADRFSLNESQ